MRQIELTNGGFAVVDDIDLGWLSEYKWYQRNGYAYTTKNNPRQSMHRMITGFLLVDHINGDSLDNRRCNLREATKSTNAINSKLNVNNKTGQRGVWYSRRDRLYESYINVCGKRIRLGWYKDFNDAKRARIEAEEKYFGEWSALVCRPGDYHEA